MVCCPEMSPVCAIVGGVLGQEILKVRSLCKIKFEVSALMNEVIRV